MVNVGVDVSKSKLDVYLLERDLAFSVANEEQEIASLIKRLARYRIERVVIEATGRLEHAFVSAAIARGLPIVVVSLPLLSPWSIRSSTPKLRSSKT
jgi:transposase